MYKWGLFIAKSKTGPCDCSTSLMTVWLSWLFNFTWLFKLQVGLLDFHVTLHWFTTIWPTVVIVANMTRHDSASMFMLSLVCMSNCNAAEWWMSSWCITTSPPHGKVCVVFDGHWGSPDVAYAHCSFACTLACLTCLSIRESFSSHVRSFAKTSLYASFVHPFTNTSSCMYSPNSSHFSSRHVLFMYLYLQSLMTRPHQIHKPPSLPWSMVTRFRTQVIERENKAMKLRKASSKMGCGLQALLMKIA